MRKPSARKPDAGKLCAKSSRRLAAATLFAAGALLASPGALDAQRAFGVKGGVTFADAHFYDSFTSRSQTRGTAGGFASFPISNRADVQLELLYLRRGFATTGEYWRGTLARMSYLDVPVLLRFRLTPEAKAVRPLIFGGGYWGHEVGCRTEGGVSHAERSNSCEGRFQRRGVADVGLVVGAGLEVTVAERWFILLDARYHYGVRNLHWDPTPTAAKSRNLSVVGGVGVRLPR